VLAQAAEYIVEHAQGVFLWVKLVGEELLAYEEEGYSEEQIFEFLKRLPTELEDLYRRMLERNETERARAPGWDKNTSIRPLRKTPPCSGRTTPYSWYSGQS